MIDLIPLSFIDSIINDPAYKLSPLTQILYIRTIISELKNQKYNPNTHNAFFIDINDADFQKWEFNWFELAKYGIIAIHESTIEFFPEWSAYISQDQFTQNLGLHPASKFEGDLLDAIFLEKICLHSGLSIPQMKKKVKEFIDVGMITGKTYNSQGDIKRHFFNWLMKNLPNSNQPNNKIASGKAYGQK